MASNQWSVDPCLHAQTVMIKHGWWWHTITTMMQQPRPLVYQRTSLSVYWGQWPPVIVSNTRLLVFFSWLIVGTHSRLALFTNGSGDKAGAYDGLASCGLFTMGQLPHSYVMLSLFISLGLISWCFSTLNRAFFVCRVLKRDKIYLAKTKTLKKYFSCKFTTLF